MINIAIKLATSITYTADGSQTNFSVPFDYLRPAFVHVSVNDAEVSEGFTISNRMVMFDSAPSKDAVVRIYRSTPTTRLVSWADASILKAIDMTIASVQQLHILEEGQDWSKTNSIIFDKEMGAWQGRKCRVSNVADPTEAQDVVTKKYLESTQGNFVKEATKQANLAKIYAEEAKKDSDEAERAVTAATTAATNANVSAANAADSAELSQNSATDAARMADKAAGYVSNVTVWDSTTEYKPPDVVMTSDGSTYRCIKANANTPPQSSADCWAIITSVAAETFEYDEKGDLMPLILPRTSSVWEAINGEIIPIAL